MAAKTIPFGPLKIDPIALGSQGNAVLGIRDSGKTYTATLLAEGLFKAGIPFIAFDPIGVWRFLRVPGAGSNGRGFPIVVAGGQDGDLPLTPASAPAIVEAAMANGVSLVLDLYSIDLSKADWRRIVTSCLEVLLHKNRSLRHVFIEEAAEFAPQQIRPDSGAVYAAVEKLARMGGNARLGYTLINQRAEEVNKAVLELCDNLFLHRQKGRNSLTALSKWLDIGNVAGHKAIIETLSTLPTGQCWAWLAGSDTPVHTTVPLKQSLAPDRRVMRGDKADPVSAKAVDVGAFVETMRASLAQAAETAKANDPKLLQARIRELTAELATKPAADPQALEAAEAAGYRRGKVDGYAEGMQAIGALVAPLEAVLPQFKAAIAVFEAEFKTISGWRGRAPKGPPGGLTASASLDAGKDLARSLPPPAKPVQPRPPSPASGATGSVTLTGPQAQLLKALAWWKVNGHNAPSRAQVAAIAGWKITSGHLKNVVGSLKTRGLVDYPTAGQISMTPAGEDAAPLPDLEATFHDSLRAILTGPQRQIFDLLLTWGRSSSRAEIAEALGWTATSGHLKNVVGSMKTLEILEYPSAGVIDLQPWVRG